MKPEEARFILSAIRPEPVDPSASAAEHTAHKDPNVAAAFQAMKSDPQLKAWYDEHCRFDEAVADRLGDFAPPADLEATILAGLKISDTIPWWQSSALRTLAVAAAVMLIASVGYLVLHDSSPSNVGGGGQIVDATADFRRTMVSEIQQLKHFDEKSGESAHLVTWLNEQEAPTLADLDLPSTIGGANVAGCKLLEWNGQRASLLCFIAPDDNGEIHSFHLVMVDESALDGVAEGPARISTENGWSTAVWRQGSKVCLLATNNTDTTELRKQSEKLPLI